MKKAIFLLSFVHMMTFCYKITNSSASSTTIKISVYKCGAWLKKASSKLKPGQSAAWNQKDIRKKLKVEKICMNIDASFAQRGKNKLKIEVPVSANIEVLAVGGLELEEKLGIQKVIMRDPAAGRVIYKKIIDAEIGAVDYSTKQIYNRSDLEKSIQILRKYEPQNLSKVSGIQSLLNTK